METKTKSRRNFIKWAGVAGLGLGAAACASNTTPPPPTQVAQSGHEGMEATGSTPAASATPEDMDAMHEAGVKTFLDNAGKDATFWGNKLAAKVEGDTKVFNITCSEKQWDTGGGAMANVMAYNGTVPGPEIRVTEGDKVRVVVKNDMTQSTAVHFHGMLVPNAMDGVPFITQPPIKPGTTFTYEFVAKNSGSHMYHSHHNATEQVTRGLLGAFIVERKDKTKDPAYDSDYTLILNDGPLGFTLNGKSFPATQPILAKLGEKVRIRYMNEGLLIHPMHLHGLEQQVFAKDGWNLPQPFTCDTLNIAPGERWDVLVDCHTAGAWAFHCHILSHAESSHGMFGMVTALVVQ
ncbi:MAG: multicopper oxidase domain-containing protein [Chloroflexi bacterium]|nr:multicopper oxidase domain-containing protein [Chloroflexota bacterium]